jgi:hypothetical protein
MSSWGLALVLLAAPEQPTVVVAGVQAKGFEPHVVEILLSDLRAAIGRSKNFSLITPEEMGAIDEELVRQLSGGCAEASCIAELGAMAEADFVIKGRLARMDGQLVLFLNRVDVKTLENVATARHEADDIEGVQDALEPLARQVLSEEPSMAILQVDARYTNRQLASAVTLHWQGKKIGQSPFEGEVPAGRGMLVAKRDGKVYSRQIDLPPRTIKAYIITTGRDPLFRRFITGLSGAGASLLGIAVGMTGIYQRDKYNERQYLLAAAGDALTLTGAYLLYRAWKFR